MSITLIYNYNPFDYNPFDECHDDAPRAPSPSASDASTLTDEAVERSFSPRRPCMDPWTACDKIVEFLSRKVRASKAVVEYGKCVLSKRLERTPSKTTFHVSTIPIPLFGRIKEVIDLWNAKIDALYKHPRLTEEDSEKLNRAFVILDAINDNVEIRMHPRRIPTPEPSALLIAHDSTGIIQAMAYIIAPHKNSVGSLSLDYEIEYLVTSPDNLRLSFQKDCVSGAATAVIEDVVYKSLRHSAKKTVFLSAAEKAVPFYEKLGFTPAGKENEFILTKASMFKFLAVFGGIALSSL